MKLGNIEKAKEYANKMPHYIVTQNQLMMSLLEGEEAVRHIQGNLMSLTDLIYLNVINLAHHGNYSPEEKIKIYEYSLKLFDLLFGGDYGFYYDRTHDLYQKIAKNYAEWNDTENTLKNLSLSAEHGIKSITQTDSKYTSLFTNLHDHKREYVTTDSMNNSARWLLNNTISEEIFDFCRETEQFKTIVNRLEEYAN